MQRFTAIDGPRDPRHDVATTKFATPLLHVACWLPLLFAVDLARTAGAERPLNYGRDVRAILSDHCYQCHGPDEEARLSELRLDKRESAFADLGGHAAIVPGDPAASELVRRILSDDPDERMPPAEAKFDLTDQQRATLVRWVKDGAVWPGHWAFEKVAEISPPAFTDKRWGRNWIDGFVSSKLSEEGLKPSPEANRRTLIRRVTLDLAGLPPTPDEIQRFLSDDSPDAYERLVDHLLASDACAERLAMEWLDVARYADSHGLHADGARQGWQWRDWVIAAFRENMPYNQFVTWQLAGDLLPEATRDQRLATAFLRNHVITSEGGIVDDEYRWNYVFDRVETVGTAMLGLTMQCCRCHDHKFDPISQREYYGLASFFDNQAELGMIGDDGVFGPAIEMTDRYTDLRLAELDAMLGTQNERLKEIAERTKTEGASAAGVSVHLPSPVLHLPLDKMKPIKVESKEEPEERVDGRTDIIAETPPKFVEGISGKAAQILGEYGYLEVPKAGLFDVADPLTAAIWARPHARTANQPPKSRQLLGNAGDKNEHWRGWEFFFDPENRLAVSLVHRLPDNQIRVRSVEAIPCDKWMHAAYTYDGSGKAEGVRLFVDGRRVPVVVEVDGLTRSFYPVSGAVGRPKDPERRMRVGRSYRGFTGDFGIYEGLLDDLRVYADALTDVEIAKLYSGYDHAEPATLSPKAKAEHALFRSDEWRAAVANRRALIAARVDAYSAAPTVMVFEESSKPRDTPILTRGQYDRPGEVVEPGVPAIAGAMPAELRHDRLGLSEWMFGDDNPLVARVAVNRYWQMLMGDGLASKPDDFGTQSEDPTHNELLDTLAVKFRESKWDVRELLRTIVTSATYRQSSDQSGHHASPTAELARQVDPLNRLYWRSPSRRLQAEMLRDAALEASGLLVRHVGGPSVLPYQPAGIWEEKSSFSLDLMTYQQQHGENLYRRSMYTFIRRTAPPPAMTALDAPDRSICTVKREITNTPLQALVLLNDPQFVEAARRLAEQIAQGPAESDFQRVEEAFERLTGRPPAPNEKQRLTILFEKTRARFHDEPAAADSLLAVGESSGSKIKSPAEKARVAALAFVANTIMNYDAFYSRR